MVSFSDLPLNDAMAGRLGKLKVDFAFQHIFKKRSMKVIGHEALMRPLGSTPLQLIQEYSITGGLHTIELATFFGVCKAYYERGLEGMISINSFPSECFDEEESEIFFRCFPDIAKDMFVEMLEYTDLNFNKWVRKREQILELIEKFHARGIHVLAEGIESKEELDFIITTDVDYLQGFYLGVPE